MGEKTGIKRKYILNVPTLHFIIYAVSAGVGILSSVLVVWLGFLYENAVINYFLSFTASLVITPIFAYFIDVSNSRIQKTTLQEKRGMLLYPIAGSIMATLSRMVTFCNYDEFKDKEIDLNNIEECTHIILDKYVIVIRKWCNQIIDNELRDEYLNFWKWEVIGFIDMEKQLKIILDNQVALLSEGIMDLMEIYSLNRLYETVEQARLPCFKDQDWNTNTSTFNWPTAPIAENDINNLHKAFTNFFSMLKRAIEIIPEFKIIKENPIKTIDG
ncbi:MAG: hypothetical protein K2M89_06440 [Clostridiales bacterium]|nr:hypothetical protein [Clostridiales bacterium]